MLIFLCETLPSWGSFNVFKTLGDPTPFMYLFKEVFGLNKGLIKIFFSLRFEFFGSNLYFFPLTVTVRDF